MSGDNNQQPLNNPWNKDAKEPSIPPEQEAILKEDTALYQSVDALIKPVLMHFGEQRWGIKPATSYTLLAHHVAPKLLSPHYVVVSAGASALARGELFWIVGKLQHAQPRQPSERYIGYRVSVAPNRSQLVVQGTAVLECDVTPEALEQALLKAGEPGTFEI